MSPFALRALCFCTAFSAVTACARDAPAQPGSPPLVFLESDSSGARYIRVMESARADFTPARSLVNLQSSGRINIRDPRPTLVRDVAIRGARYGVFVANASPASIENLVFLDWNGGDGIHGAAIKLNRSGPAPTYIRRVFADGVEAPDASYRRSNTDFIGIERNAAPVFVRYATGRNFGDGGIDAKSNVALMNVTIDGAHRALRAWSNVEITIANSIINVPPGHDQVWLQDATSSVRYFNVLWCVGAETPSPDARECSDRPSAISGGEIREGQERQRVVALRSNPLPDMNAFFATSIDRLVIEYSSDGGATWREMVADGSRQRPPRGDLRYRIPFNLADATYLFRVRFERNGARVGPPTTINENGAGA